jgi:hypothetical protein
MQPMKKWLAAASFAWMLGALAVRGAADGACMPDKPALSVGRIYKLTGAAFPGNRLVLRAKASGDLRGAKYAWKRDGVTVARTERLDIRSLCAEDFGTYTLTVSTPAGSATSGEFVLDEAPWGTVVAWGPGDGKATRVPPGLTGAVQLAGGGDFCLALFGDGTVEAWGGNGHGACDVPDGLADVSQIAACGEGGAGAGFAVKKDGRVAAWGRSFSVDTHWDEYAHDEFDGETGRYSYRGDWVSATNGPDLAGTVPEGLSGVVKISASPRLALALKADGSIVAWGNGPAVRVPEGLADAVDVAAGRDFALALTADGRVVAWGSPDHGETDVPAGLSGALAVAATTGGIGAGFALLADGTLAAWGDSSGFWGLGNVPEAEAGFAALDGGGGFGMALGRGGGVEVWGDTLGMECIPDLARGAVLDIAAGSAHCMALLADTDGDSIADAFEARCGRDPAEWEPWVKVSVGGTVTMEEGADAGSVAVVLLDAEGGEIARTVADKTGAWSIGDVLPGRYLLAVAPKAAADGGPPPGDTATRIAIGLEPDGEGAHPPDGHFPQRSF